jgi:hypothetical protein
MESTVTESWSQRTENQLSVVGQTLLRTPGAVLDEVYNDLTQRPEKVVQNTLIGGVVGYGATVLMRRAPVIGAVVAGTALLAEGARVTPKVSRFLDEAGSANTAMERLNLAKQGARGLGQEGALFVETLPAAGFGSRLALSAVEKSALSKNVSSAFAERLEYPLRRMMPDELLFRGPGTRIKTSMMNGDTVDLIAAARTLPAQKPYTVEYGRMIDPVKGRMSWKLPGTADAVEMGVVQKPGQISIHLHDPNVKNPLAPSIKDWRAVPKDEVGLIKAGDDNLVAYIGLGNEPIAAGSNAHLRAVVLEGKTRQAFLHDYVAKVDTETLGFTNLQRGVRVDFDDAMRAFNQTQRANPWSTLSNIKPLDASALTSTAGGVDFGAATNSFGARLSRKLNLGDGGPTLLRSTITGTTAAALAEGLFKS